MKTIPLKGMRIVVSGFELEQAEHRGIAVFSKGLLRTLKKLGTEVWLLTEHSPSVEEIKKENLPAAVSEIIFCSRVMELLNNGEVKMRPSRLKRFFAKSPLLKPFKAVINTRNIISRVFPKQSYKTQDLRFITKAQLNNSPYRRSERLAYLEDVDGVICAGGCFVASMALAKRNPARILSIDLNGFHGFINTSPLNIRPHNCDVFIQTIHDLIPLQYERTLDHLPCFTRRLLATSEAKRWFVSQDAKDSFDKILLNPQKHESNRNSKVITQSPSLHFPGDALDWEGRIRTLNVPSLNNKSSQTLQPFSYLLFNSAVVPHKNLLFAIKAFSESGLDQLGYHFCITGKPKNDAYSSEVKALSMSNKSIVFTGYVSEAMKRQLYLNALALISPSLIEGFGIPVLDAACLGMNTIASPLGSHQEIHSMHDFEKYVLLCSTTHTSDWASAMRLCTDKHQQNILKETEQSLPFKINELRHTRISRYRHFQNQIDNALSHDVYQTLSSAH
jgi:glycosyltransferase involved in cell wall biosynthesis